MPGYVARADWGATATRLSRWSHSVDGTTWHYVGSNVGPTTADQERALMRSLQAQAIQGVHGDKYVDFPYNFGFGQSGGIYEGRGWDFESGANGTNDNHPDLGDPNDHYLAFVYLAGPDDPLTDSAKDAARWLAAESVRRFPTIARHVPHSFWHATGCPGGPLRAFVMSGDLVHTTPTPDVEGLDMDASEVRLLVAAGVADVLTGDSPTAKKVQAALEEHARKAVADLFDDTPGPAAKQVQDKIRQLVKKA